MGLVKTLRVCHVHAKGTCGNLCRGRKWWLYKAPMALPTYRRCNYLLRHFNLVFFWTFFTLYYTRRGLREDYIRWRSEALGLPPSPSSLSAEVFHLPKNFNLMISKLSTLQNVAKHSSQASKKKKQIHMLCSKSKWVKPPTPSPSCAPAVRNRLGLSPFCSIPDGSCQENPPNRHYSALSWNLDELAGGTLGKVVKREKTRANDQFDDWR